MCDTSYLLTCIKEANMVNDHQQTQHFSLKDLSIFNLRMDTS